jgi:hypothetical protein
MRRLAIKLHLTRVKQATSRDPLERRRGSTVPPAPHCQAASVIHTDTREPLGVVNMDEACAMLTMTLWETATGTGRRAMRRKELIKAVPISGPHLQRT